MCGDRPVLPEKHCNVCFACLMLFLSGKKSGENFTDCGCSNCAALDCTAVLFGQKTKKLPDLFRKLRLYGSIHRSAVSSVFNLPFASAKTLLDIRLCLKENLCIIQVNFRGIKKKRMSRTMLWCHSIKMWETQNKKNTIAPRNMWERIWYNIKYSKGLNAITNGRIDIYLAYWDKMNFKGHASTSMVVDGEKKKPFA